MVVGRLSVPNAHFMLCRKEFLRISFSLLWYCVYARSTCCSSVSTLWDQHGQERLDVA